MPGERGSNRDLLGSIRLVAVLGTILLVISVGIGIAYVRSVASDAKASDRISVCRGNLVRGYLLLRSREIATTDSGAASGASKVAPQLFHILDCKTTQPLSDEEQASYLLLLEQGRFPRIEDGRVVGSDPLP